MVLLFPLCVIGIAWVIWNRPRGEMGDGPVDQTGQGQFVPAGSPRTDIPAPAQSAPAPPLGLAQTITALGQGFDGDVGIAIASVDKGWTAGFAASRIFPQQSVSKLWVAAATLEKVDKGAFSLNDPVPLSAKDLTIFHQPIRKYILAGNYAPTIGELMRYAMTQSDNTANDVLYRRVGGQAGVGGFIARKTLGQIAIGPGETILQTEMAGLPWDDSFSYGRAFWAARSRVPPAIRAKALSHYLAQPPDGATPEAITGGLAKLKRGELLSPGSTAFLLELMQQSKTGPDRLRGALIAGDGWSIAHKTGTGQVLGSFATAYNDVGILTSPKGTSYALAVMIGSTKQSVKQRQALMHLVVQAVKSCADGRGC
jgi:beta-lactamase class A